MTTKKLLKKSKAGIWVAFLVFLIAAAVCFYLYLNEKNNPPTPVPFDAVNESEEQGYLDVQMLIGPFCERTYDNSAAVDTMYAALSADNYLFIVIINDTQFAELEEIYNYTYDDDDSLAAPPPVRIYGYAEEIAYDIEGYIVEGMNEAYDISDYSRDDIPSDFGYYAINCVETRTSGEADIYKFIAMAAGIIAFCMLIPAIAVSAGGKKQRKSISPTIDLGAVDEELADPNTRYYEKVKTYVTPNYYVSGGGVRTCVRFSDIATMRGVDVNRNYQILVTLKGSALEQAISTTNNAGLADALYEDVAHCVFRLSPGAEIRNWPLNPNVPTGTTKFYKIGF